MAVIGQSIRRKEAPNKVTGRAKYHMDGSPPGIYVAKLVTSPHAHAKIVSIHTDQAKTLPESRLS